MVNQIEQGKRTILPALATLLIFGGAIAICRDQNNTLKTSPEAESVALKCLAN
jgi:hypothetical protein